MIRKILQGKIFIYPTDTLYGLGCNALDKKAVEKIREIKKQANKPFSVIAPSFAWINENLIVDINLKKYLPGSYTIILKKKNPDFLSWVSQDSLGIRIPKHEFCFKLQKLGIPVITTSVNFSSQPSSLSLEDIPKEIINKVDFIIENNDRMSLKPSTLILNNKEIKRC